MKQSNYDEWPFWPMEHRSVEQNEGWFNSCYAVGPADRQLSSVTRWTIITGGPNSGKSTALMAWAKRESTSAFVVPYPPEIWPGERGAWMRDNPHHLAQILVATALTVRNHLENRSEKAAKLNEIQREFLRWLLEYAGNPRMYYLFVQNLPAELADDYLRVSPLDMEPQAENNPLTVYWVLDELVALIRGLGFERLVVTIDLPIETCLKYKDPLTDLFGSPDLAKHPGFTVIAAIPELLLSQSDLIARSRGSASLIYIDWSEGECREIANKHLRSALGKNDLSVGIQSYASDQVLDDIGAVILEEFGSHSPGAWTGVADTLLFLANQSDHPLTIPIEPQNVNEVKAKFFSRHIPLRIDKENHGVWRGPRLIKLDEQPFNFLFLLSRRSGRPVNWDSEDLRNIAGSKHNVHSIASRTRKAIEPIKGRNIYIINSRGEGGYWLETCVQ